MKRNLVVPPTAAEAAATGAPKPGPMTRGLIVLLLRVVYPSERLAVTLRQEIGQAGGEAGDGDWRAHTGYLVQAGYIEDIEVPVGPVKVRAFRLTARGFALVERDLPADPTITLDMGI